LANTASAIKRVRSNSRKRIRNRTIRARTRSAVRAARESIAKPNNADDARKTTLQAISALDKAAEKGILHKNNASRRKSRLMKKLATLQK
jgi:small subunit ribosomal protein S20